MSLKGKCRFYVGPPCETPGCACKLVYSESFETPARRDASCLIVVSAWANIAIVDPTVSIYVCYEKTANVVVRAFATPGDVVAIIGNRLAVEYDGRIGRHADLR